jgi:hypothetical protein
MNRKIIAVSMIAALAISSVAPAYAAPTTPNSVSSRAEERIPILIDGLEISSDQPPVIIEGRTLVPLRVIFEALGATVNWNNDTRSVIATRGDISIYLAIGSNTLYKNGQPVYLDVTAQIINDRTMVPVRAVSESLGANVVWDNDTRTVYVDTNIEQTPEDPNPPIETPEEPDNPPVEPEYPEVTPPEEQQPPVVDDQAAAYDAAMDLYENGYSYQAYYVFRDLGNYRDSVEMMEKAMLLNRISYNFNDYTSKWFVTHVNDFVSISESEISSIMIQGSWLCPGSQYLGYSIDTFLPNGGRIHNDSLSMKWNVAFGGINSMFYTPGSTDNISYPFDFQKDFRKLTDGVYADIIVEFPFPINSGPYTDIYIQKGSTFGNAYEACMERRISYMNAGSVIGVRQDENGLCYLIPIDPNTGIEFGEKVPS